MQKKIIALAIAGLVSGAAFAQSNVTVYGVADIGYVYNSDNYIANTKSNGILYSGGQNGSRFGFKGSEDLGNGLSAIFRMEAGVKLDTGESDQGGLLMGRWATVGLASNSWGTIEAGRRDTFIDQAVGTANVMKGNATIGQVTPIFQRVQRYDNLLAYTSPNWSGLVLKAAYSSNAAGQDVIPLANTSTTAQSLSNNRVYALAATYTNGGLFLAANYDYNKRQNVEHTTSVQGYDGGDTWYLVGSYDFKVARVNAGYGKLNFAQNLQLAGTAAGTLAMEDRDQWQLGVSVPFGPNDMVAINYAQGTTSYNNLQPTWGDDKSSIWGVAYFHDLSKRTNVYVAYGDIQQNEGNHVKFGLDGQGTYQQAFQVGLKHSF